MRPEIVALSLSPKEGNLCAKAKTVKKIRKKTEHLTGCLKENFESFFVEGSALKFFVRSGSSSVSF